ncbi:hypothetical protein [Desulfobulbus sp.]|uniref:hypothetical protein n=1 Tax=Desulfobulbus sp. TaxID=895 RepID=UPI00286F488E|nr:hypothetical protein [Desulfobulbus sp.]
MARRRSILRVLGLLALLLAAVGATVALWGGKDRVAKSELKREAPPVRQVDRDSLRRGALPGKGY